MFTLSDETLTALHTRLSTNLNTFIDQVNTECDDPAFPVEYPQQVLDYIPPMSQLSVFPTVAIGDGTIDFADDVGWSAIGEINFAVVLWVNEFDPRALAWKLRRTMIAVANCVLQNRHLDGAGWGVTLGRIEPGPTLGRRDRPEEVVGMRALTFTVRDEQDQ